MSSYLSVCAGFWSVCILRCSSELQVVGSAVGGLSGLRSMRCLLLSYVRCSLVGAGLVSISAALLLRGCCLFSFLGGEGASIGGAGLGLRSRGRVLV